jgi:hypothetical protein
MLKVYYSAGLQGSALPLQPFTGTLHYTFAFFPLPWTVGKERSGLLLDELLSAELLWVELLWVDLARSCIRRSSIPGNEFQIKSRLSEENHGSR